jgi:hypothetical protein
VIEYEISLSMPEGRPREVHVVYASSPRVAVERLLKQLIGHLAIGHTMHLDMAIEARRHVQRAYRIEWTGDRWRRLTENGRWFSKGHVPDNWVTQGMFDARSKLDPDAFKDLGIHSTDKPGTIVWQRRRGEDATMRRDE